MIHQRNISAFDVNKLQSLILDKQNVTYAFSAIETEYALFRTSDETFVQIAGLLSGEMSSMSSSVIDPIAALLLAGAKQTDGLHSLAQKINFDSQLSEEAALIIALCILDGYSPCILEALNAYLSGDLDHGFTINDISLRDIHEEFSVTEPEALCILGLLTDNPSYPELFPVWEMPADSIDICPSALNPENLLSR